MRAQRYLSAVYWATGRRPVRRFATSPANTSTNSGTSCCAIRILSMSMTSRKRSSWRTTRVHRRSYTFSRPLRSIRRRRRDCSISLRDALRSRGPFSSSSCFRLNWLLDQVKKLKVHVFCRRLSAAIFRKPYGATCSTHLRTLRASSDFSPTVSTSNRIWSPYFNTRNYLPSTSTETSNRRRLRKN